MHGYFLYASQGLGVRNSANAKPKKVDHW